MCCKLGSNANPKAVLITNQGFAEHSLAFVKYDPHLNVPSYATHPLHRTPLTSEYTTLILLQVSPCALFTLEAPCRCTAPPSRGERRVIAPSSDPSRRPVDRDPTVRAAPENGGRRPNGPAAAGCAPVRCRRRHSSHGPPDVPVTDRRVGQQWQKRRERQHQTAAEGARGNSDGKRQRQVYGKR